ncbi:hypothetical protein [Glutamicibacter arilaitensis]|uniref:Uncharacterized protein n=1 Tax=Glutamicibacter arilaitensis TaxID=256701 RepID=A0A2N7S2J9_9MICC|nr:hypothetical protein [Glutamicibacter arilaitensis]PMQ20388.1 hypothetical protein CIK84_01860 [Glutamicibacter arilaitensis]
MLISKILKNENKCSSAIGDVVSVSNLEESTKKAMGIPDWRHVSKDKVIELVSSLQSLDKDTAKELIQKFPRLADLVEAGQNSFGKLQERVLGSNDSTVTELNNALSEERRMLERELERPDISDEERRTIRSEYKTNIDKQAAKDTENKTFLENAQKYGIAVVGAGALLAGAVLGAKGQIGKPSK